MEITLGQLQLPELQQDLPPVAGDSGVGGMKLAGPGVEADRFPQPAEVGGPPRNHQGGVDVKGRRSQSIPGPAQLLHQLGTFSRRNRQRPQSVAQQRERLRAHRDGDGTLGRRTGAGEGC
jgi:hypothetical protein